MELLIWSIFSIISTLGVAYVFYKFVDVEDKFQKKSFIIFALGVIFINLVQYFRIEYLGNIMFFIFYPILFYLMKRMPLKKLFFYVFIIWFYGTILDLIAMLLVSILNNYYTFDVYSLYFECALSFAIFVLLIIIGNSKKLKKFTTFLYKKIGNLKNIDIVFTIFSMFTLSMSVVIFFNLTHLTIGFLIFIIVCQMIICFILLIKYKLDAKENNLFLKTLKENNDFYIKMNDENRIFRHNLNAKLYSIKSVSNNKSKLLLNDLLLENNKNISVTGNIKDIPYGLNGIIYEKIYPYLDKLEIKLDNHIANDIFGFLKPRRYNVLVEKLMVSLDNAIEASLKSKEKLLIINLEESDDSLIVQIKNTFANEINMSDLGNKGYSTKGYRRGLGLFSIIRDNEANISIKIINNLFISEIVTKKKKESVE